MSYELQLKTRYAEAHHRLVYPNEKPSPNPISEPKKIKKPIKPPEFSPLFTDAKPSIYDLLRWVSQVEGIPILDLKGPRHSKPVALARQMVCYLARLYTGLSSPQIGHVLGDRDHTTVLSAVNRIKVLRLTHSDLCQSLAYYESTLDQQAKNNIENYRRCPHCNGILSEAH